MPQKETKKIAFSQEVEPFIREYLALDYNSEQVVGMAKIPSKGLIEIA